MFNNTFEFYRSKKWAKLLETLKMERLNDEGQIICEYCQKPITKAYDIIGHHKEELTDDNVNDYNISLNPANIAFVHHRCHNFIHNKLGCKGRHVFIVYGAPMSGKTEWVHDNMNEGDLVVDLDNIWECISNLERFKHPNSLKSIMFKVRDSLLDSIKYRMGRWQNAYVVGGYPLQSERERLCKELGARDVFIDASVEACTEKLKEYPELNQDEWKGYIEKWFDDFRRWN